MESWTLMRFCIYVFLYLSCLEKIDSENLWCLKIKLGPHSLPFSKKKMNILVSVKNGGNKEIKK